MPTKHNYSRCQTEHRCPTCWKTHNDSSVYCSRCLQIRRDKWRNKVNRPKRKPCICCNTVFDVSPIGTIPKRCPACRKLTAIQNIQKWTQDHQDQLRDYERNYRREWRANKRNKYVGTRLRKYGITLSDFTAMLIYQDHRCAICKNPLPDTFTAEPQLLRKVHIDHDHITGKFRGVLCGDCNMAIGLLHDDPDIAIAVADYLRHAK